MTAIGATTGQLLGEALATLLFTQGLCVAYQVFVWLFRCRRLWAQILLHGLFFAAAGFVSFCWLIGETVSRAPRWYMAAAAGLGVWIYKKTVGVGVKWVLAVVEKLLRMLFWPVAALGRGIWRQGEKIVKALQNRCRARYNARRKRREAQRAKGKEDYAHSSGEKASKRTIQASAQT